MDGIGQIKISDTVKGRKKRGKDNRIGRKGSGKRMVIADEGSTFVKATGGEIIFNSAHNSYSIRRSLIRPCILLREFTLCHLLVRMLFVVYLREELGVSSSPDLLDGDVQLATGLYV